jgi:hypothetical protein
VLTHPLGSGPVQIRHSLTVLEAADNPGLEPVGGGFIHPAEDEKVRAVHQTAIDHDPGPLKDSDTTGGLQGGNPVLGGVFGEPKFPRNEVPGQGNRLLSADTPGELLVRDQGRQNHQGMVILRWHILVVDNLNG